MRTIVDQMMLGGAFVCAAMSVVSGLRYRSKGASALCMATGFAALGALMLAWRAGSPPLVIGALGALLFVSMVGDFFARAAREADR
jgi:hypothetical protein